MKPRNKVAARADLPAFRPAHDFLVGIDSDGCVFPTMEIKQRQCFHPTIIRHWQLEPIAAPLRETAEFINLHSCHRGSNRFPNLYLLFDLLRTHPLVRSADCPLPDLAALRDFIVTHKIWSNAELERAVRTGADPALADILALSRAIDAEIERLVKNVAPFPGVRECLAFIRDRADTVCVSQTPAETVAREWRENDLDDFASLIAGQELGAKGDHLKLLGEGKYAPDRVLMIGDAPGDLRAARAAKACFYPILPGHETESWTRLHTEAFGRFLGGTYIGAYQSGLIAAFEALLPAAPTWNPTWRAPL